MDEGPPSPRSPAPDRSFPPPGARRPDVTLTGPPRTLSAAAPRLFFALTALGQAMGFALRLEAFERLAG
jgi:hypothetical protein